MRSQPGDSSHGLPKRNQVRPSATWPQVADALAVLHVVSEASTQEREEAERGMLRLATQLAQRRTALGT